MRTTDIWTRTISGIGLVMHGFAALAETRRPGDGTPRPGPGRMETCLPGAGFAPRPRVAGAEDEVADGPAASDGILSTSSGRPTVTRPSRVRRRIGVALVALSFLGAPLAPTARASSDAARNDCDDAIAAANLLNDAGDYAGALGAFDAIVGECDGKSERIAIQAGRARALNMLKRYPEALAAADAVLADDDEHLFGLFERAYANEHTGSMDAATADYEQIIQLTEKNQNVKERATIYAKVADLSYKSGKTAEAETYLAKAVELDPANPDFVIMKGDWALKAGDYAGADAAYNQATAMGVSGVEMYQIRAEGSLKMVQDKYGTTNAQELRAQMTPQEKALVCGDLNRALALGWKNPQMDMFAALTCQ